MDARAGHRARSAHAARLPFTAPEARRRSHWPQPSLTGAIGALVFGCASFTPSLLPRTWVLQGLIAGISAATGYGVGAAVGWTARTTSGRDLPPDVRRRLWIGLVVVTLPLVAITLWRGHRWQQDIHVLLGQVPPDAYAWVRMLALALALFLAIVAVALVVIRLFGWTARWLSGRLPARLAKPVAALLIVVLLVGVNDQLLLRVLVRAADSAYGTVDGTTTEGTVRPTGEGRSGSPSSLIGWETLGRRGQDFVASGPDPADLTAFSGRPALPPIRIYAGLRSADDPAARVALAVRDLERAGGFERAVLVVATTTGTGIVDPAAAETIEYLHNGDTAIVGLQYSYLPSWISFLVDDERAREAGRELFNAVYDAWASRPEQGRPRLLVTGSSLGAFGAEAAFSGLADTRNRTDGVVLAGPPYASHLHRELVEQRDAGSPAWLPVYDGGRAVRFASAPGDLWEPGSNWQMPRIVYLQHGSDPVVFWTPRLAFIRPDWLVEPRSPDVSPDMFWAPMVTFWQVSADLPFTLTSPSGHGHNYEEMFVEAWAAVAPPPGWTPDDTLRLRDHLHRSDG